MPLTYAHAFALSDNPFGPTRLLPGVKKPGLMQSLETFPLRIHEEPRLMQLYCEQAGPFADHVTEFQDLIASAGYTAEPPSAGFKSFIFLILGYKGTGKTTLANVMVHYLKQCKPHTENLWRVFDPFPLKEFSNSNEQVAEIEKLESNITEQTHEGDHCCVLLDNLIAGAEGRAFDLYDGLIESRSVFLFLLSSDLQMLNNERYNSKHSIKRFKMRELAPSDATAFIKKRVGNFRNPNLPLLNNYELFPFAENNIKGAIESGVLPTNGHEKSRITIRQLNGILNESLIRRMQELDANFDIAAVPLNMVTGHLIDIVQYYQRMV